MHSEQEPIRVLLYKRQTIYATDHNLEDLMLVHVKAVIKTDESWFVHDVIEWNVINALRQVTTPLTRTLDDLQ